MIQRGLTAYCFRDLLGESCLPCPPPQPALLLGTGAPWPTPCRSLMTRSPCASRYTARTERNGLLDSTLTRIGMLVNANHPDSKDLTLQLPKSQPWHPCKSLATLVAFAFLQNATSEKRSTQQRGAPPNRTAVINLLISVRRSGNQYGDRSQYNDGH
jgi:hypothetical protein